MKVAVVTPRLPPVHCGVGDYTALLARHLVERGVDVTLVTSARLRDQTPPTLYGARVMPLIGDWGWRALPGLCSMLASSRYDLVHVQYQNEMYGRSASICALPVALRLLRPRLPSVITVHDYGTPWPKRLRARLLAGPYGKAWFAAMLWASSRVILTNEQDEWRFLRQVPRYPAPARRYRTIPIGSNLPAGRPDVSPSDDGAIRVGYFGFVNPAKGVDTLIEGFAAAYQRCPDLRLILLCALRDDDAHQRGIRDLIESRGLAGAVTATGELDDDAVVQTLAGCDMMALPFREGISLRRTTLLAALSLGLPVISTRASIPPAGLLDGRDVVLVPPGDAGALAQAILDLAADPVRRADLGRRGRVAAGTFAWPSIAERTEELYRELVR